MTLREMMAPDDGWPYEDFPDSKPCPICDRMMSEREAKEQGICNDCANDERGSRRCP